MSESHFFGPGARPDHRGAGPAGLDSAPTPIRQLPTASAATDSSRTTDVFGPDSPAQEAPPPIEPGTVLQSSFRLDMLLGQGSVGAVYLAHDLTLERDVAIKVLLPRFAASWWVAESFRREAVAMARIHHPNVVRIYSAGRHGPLPFFVMEYVAGQTVSALIRSSNADGGYVELDTVLNITNQAALGLDAVHQHRIFHGDVKPGNMLVDQRLHVAISDFGLMGSADPVDLDLHAVDLEISQVVGTPLYVAPELITGRAVAPTERHLSDVYSLGVSVFEMLTGHGPFPASTVREILKAHLFAAPPSITSLRDDLPQALDSVLARALAKQPTERYGSAGELAFEVERAVQDCA